LVPDQRHHRCPTKDRGRRIDVAHVTKNARFELDITKRRRVAGQRALVLGPTVDVIEDPKRQAPLGDLAVISDARRLFQTAFDRVERDRIELDD
jgi:hypothetical protein